MKVPVCKFIVVILCCILAGYYVMQALEGWEQSPTSTSTSAIPLREFEFPAITVCPVEDSRWLGILDAIHDLDTDGNVLKVVKALPRQYHNHLIEMMTKRYRGINPRIKFIKQFKSFRMLTRSPNIEIIQEFRNTSIDLGMAELLLHYENQIQEQVNSKTVWSELLGLRFDVLSSYLSNKTKLEIIQDLFELKNIGIEDQELNWPNATAIIQDRDMTMNYYMLFDGFQKLAEFTANIETILDLRYYRAFALDIYTNYPYKYEGFTPPGLRWSLTMAAYIYDISLKGNMDFPVPFLHDAFNLPGAKFLGALFGNSWNHPNEWLPYFYTRRTKEEKTLFYQAINCFYPELMPNPNDDCQNVTDLMKNAIGNYLKYLKQMQTTAHFNANDRWIRYPMIPFCWFGRPFSWIGKEFAYKYKLNSRDRTYYNLTWCDLFEPTLPIKPNCFTTKGESLDQVKTLGADNGLMFVLDLGFGQDGYSRNQMGVSHKLYVHERNSVPDMLGITEEGVEISYGQKHEIKVSAEKYAATKALLDIEREKRNCLMETEFPVMDNPNHSLKAETYYQTTCMVELLIENIQSKCDCLPWNIAEHFKLKDYKVCVLMDRRCAEEVKSNMTIKQSIISKCPMECSKMSYSVQANIQYNLTTSNYFKNILTGRAYDEKSFLDNYVSNDLEQVSDIPIDMPVQYFPNHTKPDEKFVKRLQTMTVVSINFGPGFGTVFTKDVKATFSDKLGVIGGTFGIFLGVSFLGLYGCLEEYFQSITRKIVPAPRKKKPGKST